MLYLYKAMTLLTIYGLLWVLMLFSIGAGVRLGLPKTALIGQLSGLVGLTAAFLQALVRNSLSVFFLWQRLRIKFNSRAVTRWSFSARFDGSFGSQAIPHAVAVLTNSQRFSYPTRVETSDDRSALLTVDDSLVISLSFEPAEFAEASRAGGTEVDHVTVLSKTQELPFQFSVEKIDQMILPMLSILKDELRPSRSSYDLNVDFRGSNPFFEVYISKLKPEQVGEFSVVLHVPCGAPNRKERVEISKSNVHVIAASTDSFRRLASDFILLSPDVKMLAGVKKSA